MKRMDKRIVQVLALISFIVGVCMMAHSTRQKVEDVLIVQIEKNDNNADTKMVMEQSIVHISMKDSVGSGVIVSIQADDIIVVSNKHLLQKDVEAAVTLANGTTYEAEVLGLSQQYDIGFLKLRVPEPELSEVEQVSQIYEEESFYLGTAILQYSSRQAGVIECYEGYISGDSQYMDEFHSEILQTNCYSAAGMSGGAVFHTNGEFLGMIAGGEVADDDMTRESEITYCIPAALIWDAYEEACSK